MSVLLTANQPNRSRICEILFEEYSLGNLLLQSQNFLALADNRTWTGISVHLGKDNSTIVPYYNGCALNYAKKS